MWPFRKKREIAPEPRIIIDAREWNEDWKVGDTAESIVEAEDWHESMAPWERPQIGDRFIVTGFADAIGADGETREYFLKLEGWGCGLSCTAFRKVRPVSVEQSEVVSRILNAKPGVDRVREDV